MDKTTIYKDAQIYDFVHSGSRGKDFDFYRNLSERGQTILEIACGTGRLTIPLAEDGLQVTGLDFSQTMLEEAEVKAKAKNLNIQWVHADCRSFALSRKFHLIFMGCNSLQHLHQNSDVLSFLDCIKEHLEPGGIFACDLFRPNLSVLTRNPEKKYHVLKYKSESGEEMSLDESNVYDEISQINRIRWFYSEASGNVTKVDTIEMRQFFPLEIDQLFANSGFKIIEKYGGWDKSAMSKDNFKQIFVCKRF